MSGTDSAAKQAVSDYQSVAYEGTSYEYPTRRLINENATPETGKTREEALTSRRLGSNLATSKLWVLYEFMPFHMSGMAALLAPDLIIHRRLLREHRSSLRSYLFLLLPRVANLWHSDQ